MGDTADRTALEFFGTVKDGVGRFSKQLVVPGRESLPTSIRDWPEALYPGTLNVQVSSYPDSYLDRFGSADVRHLDSRAWRPEIELPFDAIVGNTLPPTAKNPDRGRAQVWRASLQRADSGDGALCWVLRRIGSGLHQVLEIVSDRRLREVLGIQSGDPVTLLVEGEWADGEV